MQRCHAAHLEKLAVAYLILQTSAYSMVAALMRMQCASQEVSTAASMTTPFVKYQIGSASSYDVLSFWTPLSGCMLYKAVLGKWQMSTKNGIQVSWIAFH